MNIITLILSLSYNIIATVIYLINTYCLGYVLIYLFQIRINDKLLNLILIWALGWNTIVFLVHLLGLISAINKVSCLVLCILGILLAVIMERKAVQYHIVGLPKNLLRFIEFLFRIFFIVTVS